MRADVLDRLRCPACGDELRAEDVTESGGDISSAELVSGCGETFRVSGGVADFLYPHELREEEEMMKEEFDRRAGSYDSDLEWQFDVFDEDKDEIRRRMVDLLELKPGMTVLETGAGTGSDSVHILPELGPKGRLYGQDISLPMLEIAREKLADQSERFDVHVGNASYLPFEDDMFDAAYHFGALNFFADRRRALEEMTRVVRPGGKVVVGDEGIAPWLRRRLYGKIMIKTNKNYKFRPPLELLPEDVREVGVHWLLGDSFYVIDFRVGEGSLPMNLDLPMPGKSDTLRSRYYGTGKGAKPDR
jgi:ubiquinone/menaquinone biosynthesis C-methylase UbiE